MHRLPLLVSAIVLAVFGSGAHAQTSPAVQIGLLNCRGGASIGFVVGSVTNLRCVLTAAGRPDQNYVATIEKAGIDLGITESTNLSWAVFAPVQYSGPGDIAGRYFGAQSDVAFVVGLGANVLLGGSQNSFALQPLSLQSSTGVDISAGFERLDLKPGR
jgi:hypothetical protein